MRLEEKENEMKREYGKLHERYTEVSDNLMFNIEIMFLESLFLF